MQDIFPADNIRLVNQAKWALDLTKAITEETTKVNDILKELKRERNRAEVVDQALIEKVQQIILGLRNFADPEEPYVER